MRAAAFIRYHSGDGFGHIGWAFDFDPPQANAGSVENHSGHLFTPATKMGFWSEFTSDPVVPMRQHKYDDLKYVDLPNGDPVLAYRTVLWIKNNGYRAWFRNCEDDVYDVLRAYGVTDLAPPSLIWFPKTWFRRFRGKLAHVTDFKWQPSHGDASTGHAETSTGHAETSTCHADASTCHADASTCHPEPVEGRLSPSKADIETLTPWQPTWRRPWHIDAHLFRLDKFHRHRPPN